VPTTDTVICMFPSFEYWAALAVLPPAPMTIWAEFAGEPYIEWNDGSDKQVIIHLSGTGLLSASWDHWASGEECNWCTEGVTDASKFLAALLELWEVVTERGILSVDPHHLPMVAPVAVNG